MPAPVLNLDDSPVAIQQQEVFHRLMSGAGTPVFVLGRNEYAERVSRIVAADAFIDDFTKERVYPLPISVELSIAPSPVTTKSAAPTCRSQRRLPGKQIKPRLQLRRPETQQTKAQAARGARSRLARKIVSELLPDDAPNRLRQSSASVKSLRRRPFCGP